MYDTTFSATWEQRFGEGVHLVGELLHLVLRQVRVARERRAVAVARQGLVDVGEAGVDVADEAAVDRFERGREQVERPLRAVDVRPDVEQVEVGVALLLAGDLGRGDLGEQRRRAVGEVGRLVGDVLDELVAAWSRRRRACRRAGVRPSVDPFSHRARSSGWNPVHFGGILDVVDAGVDRRVEVAEALGDGLDPLVVDAGRSVELLGLREVTRADRVGERLRRGDQLPGLRLHVVGVPRDALAQLLVDLGRRGRRGLRAAGDLERHGLVLGTGAVDAVVAGVEVERERARQAGAEVLPLGEDPAGVVDELGLVDGLGVLVPTLNVVGPAVIDRRLGGTPGVGDGDATVRSAPSAGRLGVGGDLLAAGEDQRRQEADERGRAGRGVVAREVSRRGPFGGQGRIDGGRSSGGAWGARRPRQRGSGAEVGRAGQATKSASGTK